MIKLKSHLLTAVLVLGTVTAAQADISIRMLKPIIKATVDLSAQRMHVTVNGEKLHTWKISSGRRGYATPPGTFSPYRMHKMWRSRKYNNAPMPYSVFYDGGFAVHGTSAVRRLGRPASHGCVRLRTKNAKRFYDLVRQYGQNRTQIHLTGAWAKRGKSSVRVAKKRRKLRRGKRKNVQLSRSLRLNRN